MKVDYVNDWGGYVEMSATCFIESFKQPDRFRVFANENTDDEEKFDASLWRHMCGEDGVLAVVARSQKFVFGDWHGIDRDDINALAETAKTFLANGIDILPYPECWFEWDTSCTESGAGSTRYLLGKDVCVLRKMVDGIDIQYFGKLGVDRESLSTNNWWVSGHVAFIGASEFGEPTGIVRTSSWQISDFPDIESEDHKLDTERINICLAAMAMLLARETKTVERRPPAGLVKHRSKKGKVPLFSHHVVTIKPERIVYEPGDSTDARGIKRASPRLHWRRGHVRTLSSGKKVGVPPSIIGAKAGGGGPVIDKTYRVSTFSASRKQ